MIQCFCCPFKGKTVHVHQFSHLILFVRGIHFHSNSASCYSQNNALFTIFKIESSCYRGEEASVHFLLFTYPTCLFARWYLLFTSFPPMNTCKFCHSSRKSRNDVVWMDPKVLCLGKNCIHFVYTKVIDSDPPVYVGANIQRFNGCPWRRRGETLPFGNSIFPKRSLDR